MIEMSLDSNSWIVFFFLNIETWYIIICFTWWTKCEFDFTNRL